MRRLSALLNFSFLLTALTFPCSLFGAAIFHDLGLEDWIAYQEPLAFKNLIRNISAPGTTKGSVLASPSKNNPDYFFHWVRDAAIVMDEMVTRYETTGILKNKNRYLESLIDYIYFSKQNQQTPNLSGGLGEPKFNVDGTAFSESWGRPQDDGPAMRATTLIHLAKVWLKEGNEKLVVEKLYDGTEHSIIKKDLEYVSHQWKNVSFELWEEVKGHHFHTRMVQYRSMIEGAELANLLSDFKAANWYLSQALEMEPELERHWSFNKRILVSTLNREDGLDYKYSELDSSVILGINQGHVENGFMSFSDDRVLATVNALEEAFYRLYSINRNGAPGIAMGRYPEDRYDGFSSGSNGNPWFLITSGFAEFYYRLATDLKNKQEIKISAVNKGFYRSLGVKRKSFDSYKKGSSEYKALIEAIHAKGDSFLSRVKYHVDGTGSVSEQINRDSGYMQGARDLTWSYAALLSAIRFR